MKFRIPFTSSNLDKLKKRSNFFRKFVKVKKGTKLEGQLKSTDIPLTREEYLSICLGGFVNSFLILFLIFSTVLVFVKVAVPILIALGGALLFSGFIYLSRRVYPKVFNNRREKQIDKDLIPALQDVLVQLNSGIPLFNILINVSTSDYGELSKEFEKIVKKINAGYSQIEVFDEMGEKNSSLFFRRTLWQISNGMRAGGDISVIIEESVKSLAEEQLIQIQVYGNKLNPIVMFYMLISVIIPALSITFLTILSSLLGLPSNTANFLFIGMFVFVVIIQVMFLGVIRSIRPSLL